MKSISKQNLVVGKWYIYAGNYYIKFSHHDGSSVRCSEYITDNGRYVDSGGGCTQDRYDEADMSIVTKYLPDNHPDKTNYYEIY